VSSETVIFVIHVSPFLQHVLTSFSFYLTFFAQYLDLATDSAETAVSNEAPKIKLANLQKCDLRREAKNTVLSNKNNPLVISAEVSTYRWLRNSDHITLFT
jgi:hypothetical protein